MRLRPRSFASILNASRSGTSRSSSATGSETDSGSPGGRGFGLGAGAEGTSGGASRMSLWRLEPAMPEMLLTASLRGPIISIITPPSEGETRISSADFVDERNVLVAPCPALAFPLFYPEHVPAKIVPPVLAVGVLRETRAAPVKRDRRAAGVRRCGKRHIRPAKLDEYLARPYLMHANALDERRARGSFSCRRSNCVSFAA